MDQSRPDQRQNKRSEGARIYKGERTGSVMKASEFAYIYSLGIGPCSTFKRTLCWCQAFDVHWWYRLLMYTSSQIPHSYYYNSCMARLLWRIVLVSVYILLAFLKEKRKYNKMFNAHHLIFLNHVLSWNITQITENKTKKHIHWLPPVWISEKLQYSHTHYL